jgi:RNA polymerase sigma-70 factor, ECF subfamily
MAKQLDHLISADEPGREEAELLRQVAGGDEASFARLYDRYARPLFSVAMNILREVSAAEDALQDVFVQIWERAADYDPCCGKPLTWAVVLTRNKCIDRIRAQQRRHRLTEMMEESGSHQPAAGPGPAPEQLVVHEQVAAMRRALTDLPPEQRQAIELAFLRGLTQTEIATQLELPLGTVKARIRRGMLQLRARMERGTLAEARIGQN